MAVLRKSTNELSIRPKLSRSATIAIIVSSLVAVAALLYFTYDRGVHAGHVQFDQDKDLIGQLNSTIGNLRQQLDQSEEKLIVAQRHQQIQEEAYKQISAAYASSEQKNRYLGSRLDFYRSIISPEDGQSGPAIQALQANQADTGVEFDVTLVQAIRHKHQVRGTLRVELYDEDSLLKQWPNGSPRSINFQYFQQISGVFDEAILPENAKIRVELDLQDSDPIERWFDVAELSSEMSAKTAQ